MTENPQNEPVLPASHKLFKTKAFLALAIFFITVRLLIALFVPNRNLVQADDLTPQNILTAVNQQRSLRNLVTLNVNSILTEAAQSKSDDMQARHYFAHVDPDGHYIWDKIVADGYTPYVQLGENLAIEFYDTDSLITAWMNSPEHRANILQEGFKDDGMGVTFGDVSAGQYHSAIANTFGTLAVEAKPKAPVPTPAPQPAPVKKAPATPAPKTPTPSPTPTPAPIAVPTPAPAPVNPNPQPLVSPRIAQALPTNPNANFSLPPQAQATSTTTTPPQVANSTPSPAIIGNASANTFNSYDANHYLILFCGIGLLLLMLSDIQNTVQKKFASLDKKINNLVVLLIALVVIAFMYWL